MRMRELRFKVVIILDKLTIYLISTRRKSGLQDEKSRVAVCRVRGDAGLLIDETFSSIFEPAATTEVEVYCGSSGWRDCGLCQWFWIAVYDARGFSIDFFQ